MEHAVNKNQLKKKHTHTRVHMLGGKMGDTFVHVLRYVLQNYMSFVQIC